MSLLYDDLTQIGFVYADGGRLAAGSKGDRDCVYRAIAIALEIPYPDVVAKIGELAERERPRGKKKRSSTATGVWPQTTRRFMDAHGWAWTPTMTIGSGCRVHLRAAELPAGRLVVRVSKHVCAVIDGVVYDTYRPDRDGDRCVYGYWSKP